MKTCADCQFFEKDSAQCTMSGLSYPANTETCKMSTTNTKDKNMKEITCPKCGSNNIFELFYGSSNYQCHDCRYSGDKKEFPAKDNAPAESEGEYE